MTCDSLYQYRDSNYIEAFGRVHVVQDDTLNLWGDFLTYNGNTEQAKVRDNVIMQDPQITLTTNFLDYDAANRIGHYFNGGTIKDSINTLISDIGYYFVPINQMFFKDSVKVYTPDYTMYSDTLKYQTDTKLITILGPTHIYGDNRTLYSEDGWYNSLTSHAELYKNNQLTYNNYLGKSDTLVVDSLSGTAIMRQNLHLYDTVNIHGDTLSISKDSIGNNVMKAFHDTKFYSLELQGVCDSMVFPVADSTVFLYKNPIVWASGNQMTATDINMHIRNNQVDQFHLNNKAMIVNQVDSTMYKLLPNQKGTMFNQIKGRDMTGYVNNNELRMVLVNGSGESLYYVDDKGIIIGLNKAISSNIRIELENKKIQAITFINKAEGSLNPLFMVKEEDQQLRDFHWYIDLKPLVKEDIFK